MKTVWKYEIGREGREGRDLDVPKGAKFLDAQIQNGVLCLWALVDPDAGSQGIRVNILGTGWQVDEIAGEYLATVQPGGGLVFHIFIEYDV